MTIRVNGGILNDQTLTGRLRFFKMSGPFAWTVSDGSVNLPVSSTPGYSPYQGNFFVVGSGRPVPLSAAELAFREITRKCEVVMISLRPGVAGTTTEIHFAVSASAFGWGAGTPEYGVPPGTSDEDPAAAAPEMQAAVRALGSVTVYSSVGAPNQAAAPVTATANLATVTITEVPFALA